MATLRERTIRGKKAAAIASKIPKDDNSGTSLTDDMLPSDNANDVQQPKTLADRFAGDKNLIRLTPAQKKMYRKEGYSDVNDYKTILAPGTVFRPGYKPMYDSDKSTDKPKMESGIGTAESGIGLPDRDVTINGRKLWSGDWASQNPDVKPSVNSKSKGKEKFVAPKNDALIAAMGKGSPATVENNPNPTVKNPVKTSVSSSNKFEAGVGPYGMIPKNWREKMPFGYMFGETPQDPKEGTFVENTPNGLLFGKGSNAYEEGMANIQDAEKKSIFAKSKAGVDATFKNSNSMKRDGSNIPADKKSASKFSTTQEATIAKYMKENPAYSREQIIDTLTTHKIL